MVSVGQDEGDRRILSAVEEAHFIVNMKLDKILKSKT